MTRINTVSPEFLTDVHLMAEYRELPRIFTQVKKYISKGVMPTDLDIPEHYCLGKGHVMFFVDKLSWLRFRYCSIYNLLKDRGFNLDDNIYYQVCDGAQEIPDEWWGAWTPRPEDYYLNMARLARRSKMAKVLEELKSIN